MSSELALNTLMAHGSRWKRYPAYRDSGVEWLGEVPEGWAAIGLKRLLDSVNGIKIGPFGSQLKSDIIQPAGFKVYGQENVIARNFDLGNRFVDGDKFKELAVCEIISGDIVVTMMGTTGRCQVVPENIQKGIMDSHLLRIRINEMTINPIFLEKIIDEALYIKHQIKVAGKGSIMHGLNSSIIKSLSIALPPLPEQRAIAAFLDRETGRIDTLIEKKERQVELLQEKRAALISHAVTKGLDPYVKMKDSGVEWLGEVPEHWKIMTLKRIGKVRYGLGQPPSELSGGVPLIRATNINRGKISDEGMLFINPDEVPGSRGAVLSEGEIIIVRSGAYTGDSAIIPFKYAGAIAGYDTVLTIKKGINRYFAWQILSKEIQDLQFGFNKLRAAQPHLNAEEINEIIIVKRW